MKAFIGQIFPAIETSKLQDLEIREVAAVHFEYHAHGEEGVDELILMDCDTDIPQQFDGHITQNVAAAMRICL